MPWLTPTTQTPPIILLPVSRSVRPRPTTPAFFFHALSSQSVCSNCAPVGAQWLLTPSGFYPCSLPRSICRPPPMDEAPRWRIAGPTSRPTDWARTAIPPPVPVSYPAICAGRFVPERRPSRPHSRCLFENGEPGAERAQRVTTNNAAPKPNNPGRSRALQIPEDKPALVIDLVSLWGGAWLPPPGAKDPVPSAEMQQRAQARRLRPTDLSAMPSSGGAACPGPMRF